MSWKEYTRIIWPRRMGSLNTSPGGWNLQIEKETVWGKLEVLKVPLKKFPVISIKPWTFHEQIGFKKATWADFGHFTTSPLFPAAPQRQAPAATPPPTSLLGLEPDTEPRPCMLAAKYMNQLLNVRHLFLAGPLDKPVSCHIMPVQLHPSDVWKVSHCWPRWRHGWHWWCSACSYRIPWRCSMQLAPNVWRQLKTTQMEMCSVTAEFAFWISRLQTHAMGYWSFTEVDSTTRVHLE